MIAHDDMLTSMDTMDYALVSVGEYSSHFYGLLVLVCRGFSLQGCVWLMEAL
jgi:hypothetical protein